MKERTIRHKIISSLLQEFAESYEMSNKKESLCFEHFVNNCVANHANGYADYEFEKFQTGNSFPGIDGIIVVVNDDVIYDVDDLSKFSTTSSLRIKFILISTKRSASFNNGELSNLMTFARKFFNEPENLTPEAQRYKCICDRLFESASKFTNNPLLKLYYVTTSVGVPEQDVNINAAKTAGEAALNELGMFSSIETIFCGAEKLQQMYKNTTGEITAEIMLSERPLAMFSQTEGGTDETIGYMFVVPFREYKKLIIDDSDNIKPVFDDNIRDYLGHGGVNDEIKATLEAGNANAFCMLNNGITIVADFTNINGLKMTIRSYQVVNGCQTSHVLYENRHLPQVEELLIPIRLIQTKDEDLKNQIAKATNNQAAVQKEQLIALTTFQRTLEEFYKAMSKDGGGPLYYERRTGQYRNEASISNVRVVDIRRQAKAVTAMFLEEPETATRRYGQIMGDKISKVIFNPQDNPYPYYVSALALYKIEHFIRQGLIDRKYQNWRFHIILMLRVMKYDERIALNCAKLEAACAVINGILMDENECLRFFTTITKEIDSFGEEKLCDRNHWTTKSTTELVKELARNITLGS